MLASKSFSRNLYLFGFFVTSDELQSVSDGARTTKDFINGRVKVIADSLHLNFIERNFVDAGFRIDSATQLLDSTDFLEDDIVILYFKLMEQGL